MATRAKVNPRTSTPTHTISLSDGVQNWGLRLDGDYKYIQETPQTPSTIMINSQGNQYGDFDPSMSHIQQSEWIGGMSSERFVDDQTRYFDSKNLWTLSSGMIFPTLQWHWAMGAHQLQNNTQLAKNYAWKSLTNNTYTSQFTNATEYLAETIGIWLRKVGVPGSCVIGIWSDDGSSEPDASVSSYTLVQNAITNNFSDYVEIPISVTLAAATKYHIVIYGSASDNTANHWEVLTCLATTNPLAYTSPDRTTWTASTYKLNYRVTQTATSVPYKFFVFNDELYAVQVYNSGAGTSKLYKLTPTASTFSQASHTNFVSTEITSTGLGSVMDVLIINNIAYFAQGESAAIRRWDGTTWAADGTNKAAILTEYSHPDDGIVIYRASGTGTTDISYSPVKAFGTDLVFGTAIKTNNGGKITNLIGYNGLLYIMKTESIWTANGKDTVVKLNSQIDDAYNTTNGRAVCEHGQYLYFSLDKSLQQLYATTITDVGLGRGAGFPGDRTGYVSNMESALSKLFVSIDAGGGYSSILNFDGVNYHEIWRAPKSGKSVSYMFWYSGKNLDYPYLFWDYGGEICFMRFPDFGFNPIRDNSMFYSPAAQLVSSTIDMNTVSLPKIFKELSIVSKNLYNSKTDFELEEYITNDSRIEVDVQVDNDIDTDNWVNLGSIFSSPFGSISINKSNVYAIRFRIRLLTSNAARPPIVNATVIEGLARTPIKYQWVFRIKTGSNQNTLNGAPDHNPDKLLSWLKEKASSAEMLTMHSTLKQLDMKQVLVEPPSTIRDYVDPTQKAWGGTITVVLREA